MTVREDAKLTPSTRSELNSLVQWQGRSLSEKEAVIQAVYKQV